jgi:hypothetical protein
MNYHDPNLNSGLELRATEHRNLANNRHVLRRSPIRSMLIKLVIFVIVMSGVLLWMGSLSAPDRSSIHSGSQGYSNTYSNPE